MEQFKLIYIVGDMATGKSILARGLKTELQSIGLMVEIVDDVLPQNLISELSRVEKSNDCVIATLQTLDAGTELPTATKIIDISNA
jgi:adenylylsulfate kinase-like enzyme